MLDPRTSRFWHSALQSSLIDAEGLAACWEAIPAEKREAREHVDRRLARQAVHRGLLTLWQAQQLLAGRVTGFRVDRYILLDLIGQGGMGRVYLARDTRLNRQVALKILSPERINNPRAIARFQREARVGAQLQHEHLIRIYDFGESQGRFFLVMEYIEGKTIGYHIASQGRIPPKVAASLARQVALGLEHAHRKGLIHRDVNPYNVMVTHDGVAKLADLGLAIDTAEAGRVTREGATVGTFDYVAPEQARHSHSADIRSDVYSLGCSLYHMIAGHVPFPSPSLPEKLFAHQSLEAEPLESLVPDVPQGLAEVVRKMMRKNPAERYETPQQVVAALEPYIEHRAGPRTSASAASPSPSSPPPASPVEARAVVGAKTVATPPPPAGTAPSEEFPVLVDLGPEPSLSDSFRNNRSWFGGSAAKPPSGSGSLSTPTPAPTPTSETVASALGAARPRKPRRGLWVVGASAAVLTLGLVAFGIWRWNNPGAGSGLAKLQAADGAKSDRKGEGDSAATSASRTVESEAPISVRSPNGDFRAETDLVRAMEAAIGGKGIVVLRGPQPITMTVADKAIAFTNKGTLHLRGAEGAPATLKIDLSGRKPFLSTGSGVNLIVENLHIEVVDSASASQKDKPAAPRDGPPPPVFLVAGKSSFTHCAIRTLPTAGYAGSRAILAEGGGLNISNCWFEGFDTAVEVRAVAGASNVVRQTMFVPGGTPAEAAKAGRPVRTGWGVRMQYLGGGPATAIRQLRLDHCTFAGAGFLKLEGFSEQSPLTLEAVACAVRSESLVSWEPSPADSPLNAQSVRWTGRENQLDVAGSSWIAGPSASSSADVGDLDGWMLRAAEREPIRAAIQFPLEPETPDGRLTPQAYAVKPTGSLAPGANPADVGPRP